MRARLRCAKKKKEEKKREEERKDEPLESFPIAAFSLIVQYRKEGTCKREKGEEHETTRNTGL